MRKINRGSNVSKTWVNGVTEASQNINRAFITIAPIVVQYEIRLPQGEPRSVLVFGRQAVHYGGIISARRASSGIDPVFGNFGIPPPILYRENPAALGTF